MDAYCYTCWRYRYVDKYTIMCGSCYGHWADTMIAARARRALPQA